MHKIYLLSQHSEGDVFIIPDGVLLAGALDVN